MKTSVLLLLTVALAGTLIIATRAEAKPSGCVTYHQRGRGHHCPRPYYRPPYYRCPGPRPPRPYYRPGRPNRYWSWPRWPRICLGWGPWNVCWR